MHDYILHEWPYGEFDEAATTYVVEAVGPDGLVLPGIRQSVREWRDIESVATSILQAPGAAEVRVWHCEDLEFWDWTLDMLDARATEEEA